MALGTQYVAPDGYRELEQGTTYHVLLNDARTETVAMVSFAMCAGEPAAYLHRILRADFDFGIRSEKIQRAPVEAKLPFWLESVDESDLRGSDLNRTHPAKKHTERMTAKVASITPAVNSYRRVLLSDNPDRILNQHARACHPPIKERRFRLIFYVYLAFGMNDLVLHYAIGKIGKWDRRTHPSTVKRGAPSNSGRGHGHNASDTMIKKILDAYAELSDLGTPRNQIYANAATRHFGCRVRRIDGFLTYYHPNGAPFPTSGMFWNYVTLTHGPAEVRAARIGRSRERSEHAPYRGSFTANICNLMERVEADAYAMKEAPRGLINLSSLAPLRVVRRRDAASGYLVGIGFSLGTEDSGAYRAAQFCEAIGKQKFCSLFGLDIAKGRWVSQGLSPSDVRDRGPGASRGAHSLDPELEPVVKAVAPSHSGQSKAMIESSHPRTPKNKEAPSYIASKKSVCQLIQQEILRLITDNEKMDVTERVPDDLLATVQPATAAVLWSALDRLERNDAIPASFDEAVRAFLTIVPATADRRGVVLLGRVFGSKDLDATGFRDQIAANQTVPVQVYVLEACVRHIWIDIHGAIIELELQLPYRGGDEDLYISLTELQERARHISGSKTQLKKHKEATIGQQRLDFKRATGVEMDDRTRVKGSPKRNTTIARKEAAESRSLLRGRRR